MRAIPAPRQRVTWRVIDAEDLLGRSRFRSIVYWRNFEKKIKVGEFFFFFYIFKIVSLAIFYEIRIVSM